MSFDPVAALEGAGVTDFEVDYTLNLVQLSANDLEKVTAYIWNNYLPGMVPESGFVIIFMQDGGFAHGQNQHPSTSNIRNSGLHPGCGGLICDQHQPVHRGRDSSRVADERRRVVGKDTEGSVEILR